MTTLKLISNRLLVMALGTLVLCASATAADRDRDDRDRDRDGGAETANARSIGGCSDPLASADLDIHNVRARVYNNGALFWNGGNPLYEVPKGSGQNAIFASGLWLGGEVGGNLRFAGSSGPARSAPLASLPRPRHVHSSTASGRSTVRKSLNTITMGRSLPISAAGPLLRVRPITLTSTRMVSVT